MAVVITCGVRGQAHKAAIVDEESEEDTDEEEEQEPDLGQSDSGDDILSDGEESEGEPPLARWR